MRSIKIAGLCLAAVFVVSAVVAATAFAEAPEFKLAAGSTAFSSKGGTGKLETSKGETVECKKETNTGEVEGSSGKRAKNILISYKECTATIGLNKYKCKSEGVGANEEEIRTFGLLARLGWINKAKLEIGILFNPETGNANNPNNLFAEFSCSRTGELIDIRVRGTIIARLAPGQDEKLIEPGGHFTLEFKKGEGKGTTEWPNLEGESAKKLETETTITEKEGKGFIESGAVGSVEIFPLVSTLITG